PWWHRLLGTVIATAIFGGHLWPLIHGLIASIGFKTSVRDSEAIGSTQTRQGGQQCGSDTQEYRVLLRITRHRKHGGRRQAAKWCARKRRAARASKRRRSRELSGRRPVGGSGGWDPTYAGGGGCPGGEISFQQ